MSPRVKPVAILPTLCTLGNTFCGFLAIAKTGDALLHPVDFEADLRFAAWMILLAMVFDALDGKIARLTNVTSDFGAQLDSLTDLITFGVAPAFLVKVAFEQTMTQQGLHYQQKFVLLLSVLYVICATLRLARFTLETDPEPEAHEKFFGLPSPGAAGVVAASTFLLLEPGSPLYEVTPATRVLLMKVWLGALPFLGLLMVSRVEYVHVVSRWARGRRPFIHLVAILTLLMLAAAWHETIFFVCFAGYAIAGPFLALTEKIAGRRIFAPDEPDDDHTRETALVALGSNLGDREAHLSFAVEQLKALPRTRLVKVSPFVESRPSGGPPQHDFLNGAVVIETSLPPVELLHRLLEIERRRGRVRVVKDGPRVLDLDLVLHGDAICETAELTLPHPRFRERRFVLEPAVAIAPSLRDPVTGKTLAELLRESGEQPSRAPTAK